MKDCIFCKIVAGDIPSHKVYEDENVFAFLDIGPVSVGHTLFIPKVHAENLTQGTEKDAIELMRVLYNLAPKITKALGASGYNLGMNHGKDAGQLVFHTHIHFMPRYAGKPRTFVKTHPSEEELAKIVEKIKEELI